MIGPRADSRRARLVRRASRPTRVTPRQGIANKLGAGVTINYAADDTGGAATAAAAASDVALVFVGNHPTCGDPPPSWGTCPSQYEGREQVDRVLHRARAGAARRSCRACSPPTRARSSCWCRASRMGIGWINDNVPAIVHVTNSSQELGTADRRRAVRRLQPGRAHHHDLVRERDRHPDRDHRLRHQAGDDLLVLHRHAALPVRVRAVVLDVRVREPDAERAEPVASPPPGRAAGRGGRRRHQHQRGRRATRWCSSTSPIRARAIAAPAASSCAASGGSTSRPGRPRTSPSTSPPPTSPTGTRRPAGSRVEAGKCRRDSDRRVVERHPAAHHAGRDAVNTRA